MPYSMLTTLKKSKPLIPFAVIFSLIMIRYLYYGFNYYEQLDDYIQYYNYSNITSLSTIFEIGLLSARPLAALADVFIFSRLHFALLLAVVLISLMFAASACLFRWVFARHFGTGNVFLVVYTLLALGFEGTYWVSASSRIVVGLFFTATALCFFEKWCAQGMRRHLVFYTVLQLVSFGFYEQVLVFSIAAVLLVALLHFRQQSKRALWGLLSIVNLFLFVLLIAAMPGGNMFGNRGDLIFPLSTYYFRTFLPELLGQLKSAFLGGGYSTLTRGFVRGVGFLITEPNLLYLIVVFGLCLSVYFLTRKTEPTASASPAALLVATALICAPLAPFFIVSNTWFSLRGTVPSFCGIALFADTLIRLILNKSPWRRQLIAGFASVFSLVCCVAAISELHDYRETTLFDQSILQLIYRTAEEDSYLDPNQNVRNIRIGILNLEASYLEEQNFRYHEHVQGVTESGWALSGMMESRIGYMRPDFTPIPSSPMYRAWNCESMRLSNFDVLYLYREGELIPVTKLSTGQESYSLYDREGNCVGYTKEEDCLGFLYLNKPG